MMFKILKVLTLTYDTDEKGKTSYTAIAVNRNKILPDFPTCVKLG